MCGPLASGVGRYGGGTDGSSSRRLFASADASSASAAGSSSSSTPSQSSLSPSAAWHSSASACLPRRGRAAPRTLRRAAGAQAQGTARPARLTGSDAGEGLRRLPGAGWPRRRSWHETRKGYTPLPYAIVRAFHSPILIVALVFDFALAVQRLVRPAQIHDGLSATVSQQHRNRQPCSGDSRLD